MPEAPGQRKREDDPEIRATALLQVEGLRVSFGARGGASWRRTTAVRAVDGVSFAVPAGRTLGLIGESGCGKSTVARAVLRLVPPESGRVTFDGVSLLELPQSRMRRMRRHMQIVFQDPGGSLDPRMRVRDAVGEPLLVHHLARGRDLRRRVDDLLARCGLDPALGSNYPHQFSGGQRQRVAIARAIGMEPRLLVCDEPTSSLDVSVQAQILNLLKDLQSTLGLAYLFISHDMAVVAHMCDEIAVMHEGRIVESGPREHIIEAPSHPCTRRLLAAVPAGLV